MAHNMEKPIQFPQWTRTFFDISSIVELFDMKSMQHPEKKSEKLKLSFRRFLAPLRIMQKTFVRWSGGIFYEKFKLLFSVKCWHLLKSCKNHFPMVMGDFFFEKFKLSFSRFFGPLKNMKIHQGRPPLKSKNPGTMPR